MFCVLFVAISQHMLCMRRFCCIFLFKQAVVHRRPAPQRAIAAMQTPSCLYAFLGLDVDCGPSEINKAYRRKAVELHPDKKPSGSHELFQMLSRVFFILSDPELRAIYNAYGLQAVDQHLQNQETVMELEQHGVATDIADDIPDGYEWREVEMGEAVPVGSSVRFCMSSGRTFLLQKIAEKQIDAVAVEDEDGQDDVAPMGFQWCDCGLEGRRLVPLEDIPSKSYKDFMGIRQLVLDHRWEIAEGEFAVFKFQSFVDKDVFEAFSAHDATASLFALEILEHNVFRNDKGGELFKLFKKPDGPYVLQSQTQFWQGQRRKRSTPMPTDRQTKKPRYLNMKLDVLQLSLFEWKLFGEDYVFNKRGKNFYVAEARQPRVHSKTYNLRIERAPGGAETMTLEEDGSEAVMLHKDGSYVVVLPNGDEFVSTKARSYTEACAAQGAAYGL